MTWRRRSVLALLAGTGVGAGVVAVAGSSAADAVRRSAGGPVTVDSPTLRPVVARYLAPTSDHPDHPMYPSAAVFASVRGHVVAHFAVGDAVRYGPGEVLLPAEQRIAATPATRYDLASLTKVFTAVLVLRLLERGHVELDAPVERYLPDFTAKPAVTVRMLLTHTSGFSANVPIVGADRVERLQHILAEPLVTPAGSRFLYADKNFISLGALVERLTGRRLDSLVQEQITGPLGMRDTGYLPPRDTWQWVAATEGIRRGVVHDPAASALDGVSGHAGIFATAWDLGLLTQALLGGPDGTPLRKATVELMCTDQNTRFGPDAAHGLGVDVNQSWYMGSLTGVGHTGFTGTSFVIDPGRHAVLVLLTNRVHPDTGWGSINPARRAAANTLAAG